MMQPLRPLYSKHAELYISTGGLTKLMHYTNLNNLYTKKKTTPVCFYGDIFMPLNMTRHKTKYDWLLYLSVIWPLEWALAIQSGQGSKTFCLLTFVFVKNLAFYSHFTV